MVEILTFQSNVWCHFRLKRVRQNQEYAASRKGAAPHDPHKEVELFADYAVLDRNKKTFNVGELVRMKHKSQDWKDPVKYSDERGKDVKCYFKMYTQVELGKYKSTSELKCVEFTKIMAQVHLTYIHDFLLLDSAELSETMGAVNKLCQPKQVVWKPTPPVNQQADVRQFCDDDGRRTVELVPPPSSSDGPRRSSRKRKLVYFEYD